MTKSDATPKPSELEMTVFGPGIGECVVLHLGNGEWMVIDSCLDSESGVPVALKYLEANGIDATASVRVIVATHWHDDHIRGLAETLRHCTQAKFVMSGALASDQFIQLVFTIDEQTRLVQGTSSANEFREILEILETRLAGPYVAGPHALAQDGLRFFHGGHAGKTEAWALSPSAATITNSNAGIAHKFLAGVTVQRFKRFSPNDLSVAVFVKAEHLGLLLGADLENTNAPQFGWKAVISSTLRPQELGHTVKIAHHGSENGDHPEIWTKLLHPKPLAVVTPFLKLETGLPTDSDVARIKSNVSRLICTTWPTTKRPKKRPSVDRFLRNAAKGRRTQNPNMGYARIRVDLASQAPDIDVSLFGSAAFV